MDDGGDGHSVGWGRRVEEGLRGRRVVVDGVVRRVMISERRGVGGRSRGGGHVLGFLRGRVVKRVERVDGSARELCRRGFCEWLLLGGKTHRPTVGTAFPAFSLGCYRTTTIATCGISTNSLTPRG